MDLQLGFADRDRFTDLQHVRAQHFVTRCAEMIGVVLHKTDAARETSVHHLHRADERGRLPIALGAESVTVAHEALHRETGQLYQSMQIFERIGEGFEVSRAQEVAQTDLDAEMRGRGMAYGMRMAVDLVAAVFVGGLIGWGLDWVLGSRPWLLLLFFLLGFAAGILNVMRTYQRMQREFAARTGGNMGHSVPHDD